MSESVVVNFVANALWQLHRFLQFCLRHKGKLVLPASQFQLRQVRSFKSSENKDEGNEGDGEGEAGEIHQMGKEVTAGWREEKSLDALKM